MGLEQEVKDKARELGFDAVGITDASPLGREHVEHFQQWLQRGCAGRMEYMRRNLDKRTNPAELRKGAKSVIVVALNYKPSATAPVVGWAMPTDSLKSEISDPKSKIGRVAAYAQYEDYHAFIKSLLRELASFLSVRTGRPDRYKICVDSAPLAEKALAVRAGLGFIGRNHLLIHPQLGPQVLLGELVTTRALQPDEPCTSMCRDCGRCIEACPTGALQPDNFLDAGRCISYLTQYESQEGSPPDTHGWLFGCDECLLACPFQHEAPPRANAQFKFHPDRATLNPSEILALDRETFTSRFADSPIHRLGLEPLQRTARTCLARSL
jgi:epoxyqueuosine reductase